MTESPLRVVIVDDEPLARVVVREYITMHPGVEVVAECANGFEAVKAVSELSPDLVFLDVQMPDADGFSVLEAVSREHLPEVVFVTAHERHALRAFDVSALDFLLKPVREERFRLALERARRELERGAEREGPARLSALLDHVRAGSVEGPRRIERFAVMGAEIQVVGVGRESKGRLAQSIEGFVHSRPILDYDAGVFKAALRFVCSFSSCSVCRACRRCHAPRSHVATMAHANTSPQVP